jgi:magnesium transporter
MSDLFYDIFVVDQSHKPVGSVALSRLLKSRRPVPIADIISSEMKLVQVDEDQEDVAYLFGQRDLVSAPVVDADGRLVGVVTVDDVVDVIHEEHEEDIMRLGGVREDDLYEAVGDTTRARFSWLLFNLGTAILASSIIGFFEATIEQIVALAVLMPIVASMGGNAGTQTLTVTVRALAMKDLTATNAKRVVGKEVLVGSINGVLFAVLTGVVAWLWFSSQALGLVIGLAMIVNMAVAGFAGITIPLVLERNGIDPAIASSVFLTTITDVVGFAAFLSLASWMLI